MKKILVVLCIFILAPAAFTLSKSERIILNQWEERCIRECRVKRQGDCNRLRGFFNYLSNSLQLEDRDYDKHRKAHPAAQKQITRVRSDIRRLCPSATSRYERDLNYARHKDRQMRRKTEPVDRDDRSDPLKYRQKPSDERNEYRERPERRLTPPDRKSDNPLMRRQEPVDRDDKSDPLKYRQKPSDERYEDKPKKKRQTEKKFNPLKGRAY